LSRVGELGLASLKFIRILDPPAAMTKLPNFTKKLSMLTATRRPLILSEAPEAHGGDDPPGELELPKLDDEVHKALILLWRTPPSTTTSPCSWSSHLDLPPYRQRPLAISSLVSSKAL